MSRSRYFTEIRRIVIKRGLQDGFMPKDIRPYLKDPIMKKNCGTFIWKHAINGGNTPTLYFNRFKKSKKYAINDEFID